MAWNRPGFSLAREAAEQDPARAGLKEAVGVRRSRAKAKRRKASMTGESALSDKAQFLSVSWAYWRRDRREISVSYPGRSAGFRDPGRP